MKANDQIFERMKARNTLLCCGLDPDLEKMPSEITSRKIPDEDKVLEFLQVAVDVTAQHVCAYKAQKAFFDVLSGGHDVLMRLIAYIHSSHPGIPVIVDCKIGDIENTMAAYIQNLFGSLNADGVVANPYMGDDVMLPLARLADKSIVTLIKTSNASGSVVQDMVMPDGLPLWRHMLDLLINRWNHNRNMVPVLSSIAGIDMKEIRQLIPDDMPILLAGVGAQGGHYADLCHLVNADSVGVIVNSSRGILYPRSHQPWQTAIVEAAIKLKCELNSERGV